MPELPEVETVRRGLDRLVVGRRVEHVEVGRERVVRRTSAEALVDGLSGTLIVAARRRGKYLLCPLDSGAELMVHLRMSGQLLVAEPGAPRPPHTHVVARLSARPAGAADGAAGGAGDVADDGSLDRPVELWFVDPRTFGEVVVFDPARIDEQVPELVRLGVDPIAEPFTRPMLRRILRSRSRRLKPLLLDQAHIAGIGNIYADEILHAARLRPDRAADSLSLAAEARLHTAIGSVLAAAIDAGGSSLRDAQYVDLLGEPGRYQGEHRVYGRAGQPCRTCGVGRVRRIVDGQRSTHYCAWCQR